MNTDNFSPIAGKSPMVSTPGRNLTGLPRIISDTIADIYNIIQKWNNGHLKGIEIVREIASFMPKDSNIDLKMRDDLHNLTFELHNLAIRCSEVVNTIELCCERLTTMIKLHKKETIPCLSMPLGRIEEIARLIHDSYAEELKNKKLVVENIAFSKSESEAIFFACLWKYQIKIDKMVHMHMEMLLTDTGHRKIT